MSGNNSLSLQKICNTKKLVVEKIVEVRELTIRNTAAKSVILQRTSRSNGKVTPKLSESVNASRANPDHCFVIFPTSEPSFVSTFLSKLNTVY